MTDRPTTEPRTDVSLFRISAYDDAVGMRYEAGWYATRAGAEADMDALERESSRRYIASLDDPDEVVEGTSPYEWSVEEVKSGDDVKPIDQMLDKDGYLR